MRAVEPTNQIFSFSVSIAAHRIDNVLSYIMADASAGPATLPLALHDFVSSLVLVTDNSTGKHQTGVLVLRHFRTLAARVLLVAPTLSDKGKTKLTSSTGRDTLTLDDTVTTRHPRQQYDECTLEPGVLPKCMVPLDNGSKMNFLEEHDHSSFGRITFLGQFEDATGKIHRKHVLIIGFHDPASPVDPASAVSGEVFGIVSNKESNGIFVEIETDRELLPTQIGSLVVHQFTVFPITRWLAVGIITRRLHGERRYAMSLLDAFNYSS